MYDLGRMLADGLGREKDLELSAQWYQKALSAFLESESLAEEKQKPYLQYRIGKMYAAGLGTEQDYAEAVDWFTEAVNHNHKYAQYSLAGLYYRGQGVAQDYQMAFHLYRMSADRSSLCPANISFKNFSAFAVSNFGEVQYRNTPLGWTMAASAGMIASLVVMIKS